MTEQVAEEVFRTARDTIEVTPPPYDAVVGRSRDLRRTRRRRVVAGVAAGALLVAGLAWFSTRPAPAPENEPDIVAAKNPIDLAWYGGGQLHLKDVAVELAPPTDLVAVSGGVLYAAGDGVLVFIGPAGELTALGRKPTGSPVVASDERSWAAWVVWGDSPEMVVHDLASGNDIDRIAVPSGARPVAIDQNNVYFVADGDSWVWEPLTGRVLRIGPRTLLDVESANRIYGDGERIDMVQGFFNVHFVRPGATGQLSPGGIFALSREPGEPGPFVPLLYDTRSGERLPSGVGPGELAVDAAFGSENTVNYLVTQEAGYDAGPDIDGNSQPLVVLRTCDLATFECSDVVPLARSGGEPRLAH